MISQQTLGVANPVGPVHDIGNVCLEKVVFSQLHQVAT